MDTGTCSRRSVFRKGSCSSCPLLLTIFSVFRRCWKLHITTANGCGGPAVADQLPPVGRKTRPPGGSRPRRGPASTGSLLVGERVLGGAHLDAQGRAHQVEFLAEAPFEE